MPKTITMALAEMLEDLKKEDFDKFCNRLVDRREEPRVRRRRVEDKKYLDIADVLVSTFTEEGALDVAVEILEDINCRKYAESLVEETRGLSSKPGSSGTSQMEPIRPSPQGETRQDIVSKYKMDALPCGNCLIINNVEFEEKSKLDNRLGSNIDCDKLKKRFMSFNFNVEVKTNLKQEQIENELSAFSRKDHSQYDCCVVIILSHGAEVSHNRFPGAVYGVDGQYVTLQSITNYFNGQHCPTLQGKPKLFFIQACGGVERDKGFVASTDEVEPSIGEADDQMATVPLSSSSDSLSMSAEPDSRAKLPNTGDILVSYSTVPGYVSWRVPDTGSWYVEILERILAENAATLDLVTMLTMVNREVSEKTAKGLYKQMPGSFGFLRHRVFFQARELRQ